MIDRSRTGRLLGILLILRSKEWVSAQQLAGYFGVSLRTIYRDIEALQRNGVPVHGEPGPEGGYRLETETPLNPLQFADDDAFLLYLCGAEGPNLPDALRERTKDAIARLATVLQPEHASILNRIRRRVYFDTEEWYWRDSATGFLPRLREAILNDRIARIEYRHRGVQDMDCIHIEPYGLAWKGGEWYVVGRVLERDSVERLRVSRCISVELTEQTFVCPQDFDLKQWWTQELEAFGKGPTRVVLQADSDARAEILSLRAKENSEVTEKGDTTYLTLFVDKWNWLVPLVLSYGSSVIVEEPAELKAAVMAALQESVKRYSASRIGDKVVRFVNDDSRRRATRGRKVRSEDE